MSNSLSWCQLISNNILGFAQVLGSFATAGALIAVLVNNKQQREQWLNDAFAKEEARLWIEIRAEFFELTYTFLNLINSLDVLESYDFDSDAVSEEVAALKIKCVEDGKRLVKLLKIQRLFKPYSKSAGSTYTEKNSFEKSVYWVAQINLFYQELIEKFKINANYSIEDIFFNEFNFLGKIINKQAGELETNELVKLANNEIEQINKALKEKVTPHLKKK